MSELGHGVSIRDGWFIDNFGRHVLLRGVNLGGDSKLPTGMRTIDPRAWTPGNGVVSFVGRPFPIAEADEHLGRLSHWGFNVVRLVITWEAVEHEGPGVYDESYLEFIRGIVSKAQDHGLMVFVDPHQDVWSRFTGGDGAPLWTFELAGLDPNAFIHAGAVHVNSFDWFHNYETVPVATMWTLFWAGDSYCRELAGAQGQLQQRFIDMMAMVAKRLQDLDNVLGYDSCNEPSAGYIGRREDLAEPVTHFVGSGGGPRPWSALEYLAAADGVTIQGADGQQLNPERRSIWRQGCPWRRAGLWDLDKQGRPVLASSRFFTRFGDHPVDLWSDCMAPFMHRLHASLRSQDRDCILFLEPPPHYEKAFGDNSDLPQCDARHWYDLPTLSTRSFDIDAYRTMEGAPIAGVDNLSHQFAKEIGELRTWSKAKMAGAPLLIGEFGLPYDINGKSAYRDDDYSQHEAALEATYRGLEQNLASSTQWNYSAGNTHEHGDGWNFEDLSIWSQDDRRSEGGIDSGSRAVAAFCRPYVRRAAGRPLMMSFDHLSGDFELRIKPDPVASRPTEVYVPRLQYPDPPHITVSSGQFDYNADTQVLTWTYPTLDQVVVLEIHRPKA